MANNPIKKKTKELEIQVKDRTQTIEKQAEKLRQLDQAKSRFFANMSHELRTPLTLLLGPISSLMKENKLTSRQAGLLKMARQNGVQLQKLVNSILDLNKLEAGKLELQEEATMVSSFFRLHIAQFETLATHKQIDFRSKLLIDNELGILMDQSKTQQILANLLSNAFKHTPKGGKIEVCVSELKSTDGQEMLQLQVSDTGTGIHADDIPYLFDRYFQTNQPNKPAQGGTGIGLAICKEYATLFGGSIRVESVFEKGSTFQFVFPIKIAPVLESGHSSKLIMEDELSKNQTNNIHGQVSQTGQEKANILIVEDNLHLRDYINLVLAKNYKVIAVENGKEALDFLNTKKAKSIISHSSFVIVSDLMMPVMDGYQLLETLKSNDDYRHIPFIMLTARATMRDKLKALRIGVDDYMLKPFEEEELLARIANLLRNARMRQISSAEVQGGLSEIARPAISKEDAEWLELLENTTLKEIQQFEFKLETLAYGLHVSRRQLGRRVKELTGLTPSEYVLETRLQLARQMLEQRQVKTVKEVVYAVGVKNSKHFSRQFKDRFGKTPSEFI